MWSKILSALTTAAICLGLLILIAISVFYTVVSIVGYLLDLYSLYLLIYVCLFDLCIIFVLITCFIAICRRKPNGKKT